MDFDNVEKIIASGKKKPIKTLLIFILVIILLALSALVTNFFGEKGKRLADPSKISNEALSTLGEKQQQITNNEQSKDTFKIEQHTEGDQSPAIIIFGDPKDKKTKD